MRLGAVAAADTSHIGRFEIVRVLGKGAQGTVYLARDPHLGREVAVKTLRIGQDGGARRQDMVRALLDEARIVSKLQHAHIVTLYDAGEDRQTPYLVFEYVEGRTLAALIREKEKIPSAQAANIARQVLRGIGYAHAKGVVHRDLKPGNIMITAEGVARVMDFGIAARTSGGRGGGDTLFGTPSYMAPEYITTREYAPPADLFALGMVLYEMLTGRPAVKSANLFETLHRIVNEPFVPPNSLVPELDAALSALVIKAIAKEPEERYESAAKMEAALDAWLEPPVEAGAEPAKGTLDFLLRRIRHKSDFPALSATIGTINRVIASDRESTTTLCNSILKDFALTTKLLKLVNAAYYSQFGGAISTVSRAVAILGFDGTRSVAMSLMLFDHLQNRTQAAALRDDVAATYFSGVLAREFVYKMRIKDAEEAFVCAMFHRLGKMLVTFYLHEEAQAIERLMESQATGRPTESQAIGRLAESRSIDEERAAVEVLGMSYIDLGMGVAKKWNFPDKIINSMRPMPGPVTGRPAFEGDKLRAVSELANSLSDIVRTAEGPDRDAALAAVVGKFGKGVGITERGLTSVVQESVKSLSRDADFLGFNKARSAFFQVAQGWVPQKRAEEEHTTESLVEQTQFNLACPAGEPAAPGAAGPAAEAAPASRHASLAAGVQDITNTLVSDYQLNDVLCIILETMYRGIGFKRVLLLLGEPRQNLLRTRFGFGPDVDAIVQGRFSIPLAGSRDVFFVATSQGADVCIEDIDAERIRQHVPKWYRDALKCRGMVLFPIMLNKRPVALIYADADDQAVLQFTKEELNLLKTLRNQAVLAFKQKA